VSAHFPAFDPRLLLSAGNDKRVCFWDVGTMLDAASAAASAPAAKVSAPSSLGSLGSAAAAAAATASRGKKGKKGKDRGKTAGARPSGGASAALSGGGGNNGGGDGGESEGDEGGRDGDGDGGGGGCPPSSEGAAGDGASWAALAGTPRARLLHGSKINWLASAAHAQVFYLADVTSVIKVFDVSRV
jgi:hypothetical protein